MSKIVLASASPRRSQLLKESGIDFVIDASRADEISDISAEPSSLVLANARLKAEDVASRHCENIVLGADTIVAFGGKIYGKPKDLTQAHAMLTQLSGNTHSVFTGIALIYIFENGQKIIINNFEESRVTFKKLNSKQIDEYLCKVNVLDKAGAYAAQECGSMIIEKIEGNFDNVMGLPCGLVKNELDTISNRIQYNRL